MSYEILEGRMEPPEYWEPDGECCFWCNEDIDTNLNTGVEYEGILFCSYDCRDEYIREG